MTRTAPPDASRRPGLVEDARVLIVEGWRQSPRRLILQAVLLVITGLATGLSMLMLVPVINAVASPSGATGIPIPVFDTLDVGQIPLAVSLLVVAVLVAGQALAVRAAAINAVHLRQSVVDAFRVKAFGAILRARWAFVLQSRRSDITEIATMGSTRSGTAFNALLQASVSATLLIATATVSVVIAPALSPFVLLAMVVLAVAQLRSVRPAHAMGREYGRRNRILQAVMFDSMDSLRLVRAHNASATWDRELHDAFADAREIQLANVRRTSTTTAIGSVSLVVCASILVLIAVEAGTPAATIALVLVLAARMALHVASLASNAQLAANSLPAVQDLNDLTRRASAEAEVTGTPRGLPPANPDGPVVRLREVTFTYPGTDVGVFDLSFAVPRGRVTALVGPSGAGKSTTADLVLGLLVSSSGCIEVEGTQLTPEVVHSWRERIAYVPQDSIVLPGTVRRNLTWSVPTSVSDAQCWEALDAASAGFVRELPDGLDTELGDRGARLSGGQRQRLALARALLRRPDLLVMDEATSALDDATESAVLDTVRNLSPRPSVLLIAHRQNTIQVADHVVELANGRQVGSNAP